MEEVEKLLTVGFIREVYYPEWLANVVMVKKSNGKWQICVISQISTMHVQRIVSLFLGSINLWIQ